MGIEGTLTYALMYLEINLISLIMVGLIHYKTNGITKMVAQRNFAMAIDAEMVFFASDTIFVLMKTGLFPMSPFLALLCKDAYFMSTSLLCFFWFLYFEHMQESPFVKNRQRVWISSSLVWLMGVILIINKFTAICYGLTEDGSYYRGPLFIVLYIISYAYVFSTCLRALTRIFMKKYRDQREDLIKFALFPVAPAIAGIIQFIYPELPVACAALSFSTLIIYMYRTDNMISLDPLTRLNNRKTLDYYYDQWNSDKETEASLYLLMIDANKFKNINDTYGHVQGDKALIRIADAMRHSLRGHNRRFNIARYGGDEFAILVWCESVSDIEALIGRIHNELSALNRQANSPYDLTVSIGYHKASREMDLKDLVELADEKLYEEKKKYGNVR